MSVQALSWVFDFSEATHSARHVLLSIANHAKASGRGAWPSINRIARESRVDRATVKRALLALVELGELSIQENAGPRGCNLYTLDKMVTGAKCAPAQIIEEDEEIVEEVGASCQKSRDEMRPEPSLELTVSKPSEEPCRNCGEIGRHTCRGSQPHNRKSNFRDREKSPKATMQTLDWPEFAQFWEVYPVRVRERKARDIWNSMRPPFDEVCAGVLRWKESAAWQRNNGEFIHSAATFLNDELWKESPPLATPQLSRQKQVARDYKQEVRDAAERRIREIGGDLAHQALPSAGP